MLAADKLTQDWLDQQKRELQNQHEEDADHLATNLEGIHVALTPHMQEKCICINYRLIMTSVIRTQMETA